MMITRLEIDGFKSFRNFELNLSPFLVILGQNASGKSNLFDAIQFISRLATNDLKKAVSSLRGEPFELFRKEQNGTHNTKMRFCVEVLLNPNVRDQWGSTFQLTHTRLRYEVVLERRPDPKGIERLYVVNENATPILQRNDRIASATWYSKAFRTAHIKYARAIPYLETKDSETQQPKFDIHQDQKAGRQRPADAAEATVLSSISSTEYPHLYALREELASWRFLQLDPSSLRMPSPTIAPDMLEPSGSNLASVLARLKSDTATDARPDGILSEISASLSRIIPGTLGVEVNEDRQKHEFSVRVQFRDEDSFSARVVSDGTLRVLALLTALYDEKNRGVICFEEPENGIHPGRLSEMVRLIKALVLGEYKANEYLQQNYSLLQVVVNSHSPVVLKAIKEDGWFMFSDIVTEIDPHKKTQTQKSRIRPVQRYFQLTLGLPVDQEREWVTDSEVEDYLTYAAKGH